MLALLPFNTVNQILPSSSNCISTVYVLPIVTPFWKLFSQILANTSLPETSTVQNDYGVVLNGIVSRDCRPRFFAQKTLPGPQMNRLGF